MSQIKSFIKLFFLTVCLIVVDMAYAQKLTYKELTILIEKTTNNSDSSFFLNKQLLTLIEKDTSKSEEVIKCYLKLSELSLRLGDIPSALNYASDASLLCQKTNNTLLLSRSYYSKSRVFIKQTQFEDAISYLKKGLTIVKQLNRKKDIAQFLSQVGFSFAELKLLDSAIIYQNLALKIREDEHDSLGIAVSYSNIGYVYSLKGELQKTKEYYYKAADFRKTSSDKYMLASSYIDCGSIEQELDNPKKCIELMNQALVLVKSANNYLLQTNCYQSIAYSYEQLGKIDSAYKYHKLFKAVTDSLFNQNKIQAISKLETKYMLSSKQNEIDLLSEKNKTNELLVTREKMIKWVFVIGIILLGIILIMVYKQLKTKKTAFNQINEQKIIIEEKQKEIIDSINYAKRIQSTLMASEQSLSKNLKDHFVFFKPKDIVSGDFYWTTEKDNLFYLACCDSTGHGVPGAFMSLLNIGFLAEAIKEKDIVTPGEIFNYVRNRLVETISNEDQKDGFDGIIICINKDTHTITYAAANNNPVLVSGQQLHDLPHDKMPVGKGERDDSFKTYSINYKAGDSLYLFTDGYPDQFGGAKGKKFKYKQLEELLSANSDKSTSFQKEKLESAFEKWRGNLEQVDDVCIIGVSF